MSFHLFLGWCYFLTYTIIIKNVVIIFNQKETLTIYYLYLGGNYMFGAIIGDIVGSRFEFDNIKTTEFELFGIGVGQGLVLLATCMSVYSGIEYFMVNKEFVFGDM